MYRDRPELKHKPLLKLATVSAFSQHIAYKTSKIDLVRTYIPQKTIHDVYVRQKFFCPLL